jgi:DNA-binding FrmR family transcriptional regulator
MDHGQPGYHNDKAAIQARLKRIEVLTQVAAATKALQSVAVHLMDDHLRHCVSSAIQSDDAAETDRVLTEASKVIERLVKS